MGMFTSVPTTAAFCPRLLTPSRTEKEKNKKSCTKFRSCLIHLGMETEKINATAIPRFEEEHLEFIKERLLHRVPYWKIVDLFMSMYPDFEPEGVSLNKYRNRLYQKIVRHATDPQYPMSAEIKAALAEQDEQIVKIAHTDKFKQLIALTNYIEQDWQPRTFVKTATDENGDEYPIYKDNIGQLIQCYNMINKLADELGLVQSGKGKQPASGPPKPVNKRIAAAQAAGAPAPGDRVPTNEFPSFAGPPPKEEEDVSPVLSNPKTIVKI